MAEGSGRAGGGSYGNGRDGKGFSQECARKRPGFRGGRSEARQRPCRMKETGIVDQKACAKSGSDAKKRRFHHGDTEGTEPERRETFTAGAQSAAGTEPTLEKRGWGTPRA